MSIKQYIVDAFADQVFHGNPAAICILDQWLPDEQMTNIALENNLSETAFAVKEENGYRLRWFTLDGEIDLCGHATLACAFVLFRYKEQGAERIRFRTLSGELVVEQKDGLYEMDFPAYSLRPVEVTAEITEAIGVTPREAWMGRDLLCVLDNADAVRRLRPDQEKVRGLEGLLLHVTAPGENGLDCVSRSFAPKCAVAEDPVCGSGHCHIVPYWAKELGQERITAYQASRRGGTLYCRLAGDRVKLAGKAVLYSMGELFVE